MTRRQFWIASVVTCAALTPGATGAALNDTSCHLVQYSFEPDCFVRKPDGSCKFDRSHPDLGPQIAVWVEDARGTFIDSVMVTNAVALYGIGNRPGRWDLRSGPRFPYGRRPMVLPVWAHRRGKTFDAVVMNDGLEDRLTFHEPVSSPEPYFCRPPLLTEIVDAVTCASGRFRDAKGIIDKTQPPSYYPPRGDLIDWANVCVPQISSAGQSCDYGDAPKFGVLNDLDVIATATPAYDQLFTRTWKIPPGLPDGDYVVWLEVSKEYDQNASFSHGSYLDPKDAVFYANYGLDGNVGQPSVVFRVPCHLAQGAVFPATSVLTAIGSGDWTGATGDLSPIDLSPVDGKIGTDTGSGQGRLRVSDGPGGSGRVHLIELPCAPVDCATAPAAEAPRIDPMLTTTATSVGMTFRQSADSDGPVIAYDLRFSVMPVEGPNPFAPLDKTTFSRWAPAPAPPVATPGSLSTVKIANLLPATTYAIGLRAQGRCGWSEPTILRITTANQAYTQLSGCVIATAAYGSDLAPEVALLRGQRDWLASRLAVVQVAALLYRQTAPPIASLIEESDIARAVVRSVLRPLIAADRAGVELGAHVGMPSWRPENPDR